MIQSSRDHFNECYLQYMRKLLVYYFTGEIGGNLNDLQEKITNQIVDYYDQKSEFINFRKLAKRVKESIVTVRNTMFNTAPGELFNGVTIVSD